MGNEGSGLVVASGGGATADAIVGKNVAFMRISASVYTIGGTYQQYALSNAATCLPVNTDEISMDQAAMSFVNPLTSIGLFE